MTILLVGCLMEFSIRRKRYPYFIESVVSAIVMLVSDLIGWIAVFWMDESIFAKRVYSVSYFVSSAAYYVLLVFFVRFLIYLIEGTVKGARVPKWLDHLNIAVCGISAGFWAVNSVNGLISTSTVNGTETGPYYLIGQAGGTIVLCIILALVLRYSRGLGIINVAVLLSFVIFPIITFAFRLINVEIGLMGPALSLSLLLVHNYLNIRRTISMSEMENKLAKDRIDIMLSQIRPHFIFNTLNSIYYLCDQDTELAKEAIADFSEYLRTNILTIENSDPVPMVKEMEFVDHYLKLEQMRFRDELEIVYDLQYTDFSVPPLTIQPIVENAVRHGAMMNEDGGRVSIGSYLKGDFVEIVVSDNGPGTDADAAMTADNSHIGLRNVRERLAGILNASLTFESTRGQGSRVTIEIPVDKK
jgi:sensor histidine kinase YesM